MRYRLARVTFTLENIGILLAVAGFAVLLLGITATGRSLPLGGAIGAALFLACVADLLLRVQQAKFRRANWHHRGEGMDVSAQVGRGIGGVLGVWKLMSVIMGIVLFIVFFAVFFNFFVLREAEAVAFTSSFYVMIATFVGYALCVRPLVTWIGGRATDALRSSLPTYELTEDAIVIDFRMPAIGQRAKALQQQCRIGFHELHEVKAMSFEEAKQFMAVHVGPDVKNMLRDVTDVPLWIMGKIPRPRTYVQIQSGGSTLVLRGPDVFYAITVDRDDCGDAVRAFAAYAACA